MSKEKQPDYLVLVNEDNRLPDGFEETITIIPVENAVGDRYLIEKKTYEAFLRLREDLLENDGIQTELISVYRTIEQQEETYSRYLKNFGPDYAKKYVAIPGHSEHHTGLAIDVGILSGEKLTRTVEELLQVDHIFLTVQEKLSRYGFILRYPRGKEEVTGIGYEPWHFRYIDSPELAQRMTEQGLCFEEFWAEKI